MTRFSHRDVEGVLALVDATSAADGSEPFPGPVLEKLGALVSSEMVSYHERDIASHGLLREASTPAAAVPGSVAAAIATFCSEYPLSIERRSAATRALKISDFASTAELHRLDYYDHALRRLGIEHQLRLWLSAPPGIARYFSVSRCASEGDFGERERRLLELLRPFLAARRERLEPRPVPVEPSGNGLTEREAEILTWVARGRTNKEIAALLLVSPHTVRKHLEHAYAKLGVHTRTAAVARATARPL